jgi:ring-1,2-phenylacetyl-CoA epoxidase subunit PaaD
VVTAIREAVAQVLDPEVPVLTIDDLGVLRDVRVGEDGSVTVVITPTYSGCPAMDVIRRRIEETLVAEGIEHYDVETVLTPAWTTDWMSDEGKRKLTEYGIAPPTGHRPVSSGPVALTLTVRCPLCGSPDTTELSRFGSTACKSLWRCNACREPFDHFKVH